MTNFPFCHAFPGEWHQICLPEDIALALPLRTPPTSTKLGQERERGQLCLEVTTFSTNWMDSGLSLSFFAISMEHHNKTSNGRQFYCIDMYGLSKIDHENTMKIPWKYHENTSFDFPNKTNPLTIRLVQYDAIIPPSEYVISLVPTMGSGEGIMT